mmetsp:Transcript_52087/g.169194  ORF Transcript_52087/g.169194 Transcript_52087/m.169194 type:complete len:207 (+) Transcript_52087:113-733(+)
MRAAQDFVPRIRSQHALPHPTGMIRQVRVVDRQHRGSAIPLDDGPLCGQAVALWIHHHKANASRARLAQRPQRPDGATVGIHGAALVGPAARPAHRHRLAEEQPGAGGGGGGARSDSAGGVCSRESGSIEAPMPISPRMAATRARRAPPAQRHVRTYRARRCAEPVHARGASWIRRRCLRRAPERFARAPASRHTTRPGRSGWSER